MTNLSNSRPGRPAYVLVAISFAALALGGCDHMFGDKNEQLNAGQVTLDPSQRHPIIVSQQPHKMTLRVPRGSAGLTPAQRASVIDFLTKFHAADGGNSRLVISVPSGSSNEIAAMNAVADMRPIMFDRGFTESSVSVEPYHADNDPQPPLRISYLRFAAEGPECGKWPSNLGDTSRNLNYENFGCAQQRNLAAMVANPADLLSPRTMTPSSADRRDVTWGKYIKGDSATTERSADERAMKQK
jgi:pilus assembly protein CpaD